MMKIETITFEYRNCAECSNCDVRFQAVGVKGEWYCCLTGKAISDISGEFPAWCPLEDKRKPK